MKSRFLIIMIMLSLRLISLHANIDTTTGPDLDKAKVISSTYTFTNFELARGTVEFKKGIIIPPGITAFLDVNQPINGTIDNKGFLELRGDLSLGTTVSLVGNGSMRLNGHTLFLNGDLFISSGFIGVYASPTGTIDGQGNRLIINHNLATFNSDRFIEGESMTYKNLRVENLYKFNFTLPGGALGTTTQRANFYNVSLNVSPLLGFQDFVALYADQIHVYGNVDINTPNPNRDFYITGKTSQRLFIHSSSTLYCNTNIGLQYNGLEPQFDDYSSIWHFNNSKANFSNGPSKIFRHGTMVFEGLVKWSTVPGFGGGNTTLQFGDGLIQNDFNLVFLPSSSLELFNQNVLYPTLFSGTTQIIYSSLN